MIQKRIGKTGKVSYGVRVYGKGWIGTRKHHHEAVKLEAAARLDTAPQRMTCDKLVQHYLADYEGRVKHSSYVTVQHRLSRFAKDFRGVRLDIPPIEAEAWVRENKHRAVVVAAMFNYAVKRKLISHNPFAGLSPARTEGRKNVVPLTEDEVERLAQAAYAHGTYGKQLSALIRFAAYTGIRPGELYVIEWGDVDPAARRFVVERRLYKGRIDIPKSNKARPGVLIPQARDALLSLGPKSEGLIFTNKSGGRLSSSCMSNYWGRVCERFGRDVDLYELRHFAAYYLYVVKDLRSRLVAEQMGHAGPKLIEDLYGHGGHGALEEIDRAFADVVPLRPVASESHGGTDRG